MVYCIVQTDFINTNPDEGEVREKNWKTRLGFLYMAKRTKQCMLRNGKLFAHHGVVRLHADLSEADHQKFWKSFSKNMKKAGYEYIANRELSRNGRIHYHIAFVSENVNKETLDAAIPKALRSVKEVTLDRIEPHLAEQIKFINYFTKAKPSSKKAVDKVRHKRRLFKPECKLAKILSSQGFWLKSQDDLYKEHVKEVAEINEHRGNETYEQSQTTVDLLKELGVYGLLPFDQQGLDWTYAKFRMNEAGKSADKIVTHEAVHDASVNEFGVDEFGTPEDRIDHLAKCWRPSQDHVLSEGQDDHGHEHVVSEDHGHEHAVSEDHSQDHHRVLSEDHGHAIGHQTPPEAKNTS